MPIDLVELLAPGHTAMLTMEMQRGVIGDLAAVPDLAAEVASQSVITNAARLATAARRAGVRVVHCTAEFRADRAGSAVNAPMLAVMMRNPTHLEVGSPAAEVVGELGPHPSDVVSSRRHGISPFTGTDLDSILRNLGVTTVVATGVSVNLGVLGLAIEAVNLGYRVAVVTDAVAGVPREYGRAVIDNTIALLATRVAVDDVIAAWKA
ncbi:MAG: cysteine hydrolase [Actinobacteria bacterium]|nr:MAG: cysteine hydrolase [Actinomycetota bacterium]